MAHAPWPDSRTGRLLVKLEQQHCSLGFPSLAGPFEMVLWEIVAYLVDDSQREQAFQALRHRVGLSPRQILASPMELLREIARIGGSIAVDERAGRLQAAARLVIEEFGGDLGPVLQLPAPKAKKALMRFPMIGEPGAEKILLFSGAFGALPLDSNGLRVAVRLGLGEDRKSYAATYRAVRQTTLEELPPDPGLLTTAYLLFREHGRKVCVRSQPECRSCLLNTQCAFVRTARETPGADAP